MLGLKKMSMPRTLDENDAAIIYLRKKDKRFAKVFSMVGPISYSVHDDGYSFLIHEIVEQMLSTKAAQVIFNRLEARCDGIITPDAINSLSDSQIRETGTSGRKVQTIRAITDAIENRVINLKQFENMTDSEITTVLTSINGIGNWTAKMYLIFVLDRPDVLPFEDAAFLQGYKWAYRTDDCSPKSIQAKCKKWSPYSSTAARYMYRALDSGLTKQEFHLFK